MLSERYWLTEDERAWLNKYKWEDYRDVNKTYRQWGTSEKWEYISSVLKKLPSFDWVVYRGTQLDNATYNRAYWWIKEWDIITEPAFTSTSTAIKVAEDFLWTSLDNKTPMKNFKNILFKIKSKNGKFILNPDEKEILFDRWTKFRVTGKDTSNPVIKIYLEEI